MEGSTADQASRPSFRSVHHSLNVCSPLTFSEHRYRIGKPRSTSSTRQCSPFFCAPLSKQRHRHPAQLSGKYRNASVPADQSHLSFHQLCWQNIILDKLMENLKKLQEDRTQEKFKNLVCALSRCKSFQYSTCPRTHERAFQILSENPYHLVRVFKAVLFARASSKSMATSSSKSFSPRSSFFIFELGSTRQEFSLPPEIHARLSSLKVWSHQTHDKVSLTEKKYQSKNELPYFTAHDQFC